VYEHGKIFSLPRCTAILKIMQGKMNYLSGNRIEIQQVQPTIRFHCQDSAGNEGEPEPKTFTGFSL
jgi:hypothetical protein